MIIKAFYMLDGDVLKSVRFEANSDHQPEDIKVIYANAPEKWDECVWDHGSVKPMRKKRSVKVVEEVKLDDKIADDNSE